MKKLTLVLLLCAAAVFSAFSETKWFVCLGSFSKEENAENRAKVFNDNGYETFLYKYEKDDKIYYRVLLSAEFDSLKDSRIKRNELLSNDFFKSRSITDLWCCEAVKQNTVDPEKRYLIIKDSDTGNPIADANVNIDKKWDIITNTEGKAPLPDEIDDGEHTMEVTKGDEYVSTATKFSIDNGEITSAPQISIPKAVDYERIKIVLYWGETPSDLDSHVLSNDYHLFFSNMSCGNMTLDRDDTDSFGPETVTIQNPDKNDVYSYFVHNYSDKDNPESSRLSSSEAQVTVYINNEFKGTYKVKSEQTGVTWNVFDVVNGNEIVVKDIVK